VPVDLLLGLEAQVADLLLDGREMKRDQEDQVEHAVEYSDSFTAVNWQSWRFKDQANIGGFP
jgi:hypothetical protein